MDQGTLDRALRDALGHTRRKDGDTDKKTVIINIQGDLNININDNSFHSDGHRHDKEFDTE